MNNYNCIVVLGSTASGKTKLACRLAAQLNGEIISADSRQVYKGLNIGTGKDYEEYFINGQVIKHHLIDIIEPGEQFYLHQFIQALQSAFQEIISKHQLPIICGGTGLYLDALSKDFSNTLIPENLLLRTKLEIISKEDLLEQLQSYPKEFTSQVDLSSKKRIIRGIEIVEYKMQHPFSASVTPALYQPFYLGLQVDLEKRKELITARLKQRLDQGLIEEVEGLIKQGLSFQRLERLGLEYKFVAWYLQGVLNKTELLNRLQTAIFQFAKRQMTWFRKMEREGINIKWIAPDQDITELAAFLNTQLSK
jgi:tRNA dimethylallyltransferase